LTTPSTQTRRRPPRRRTRAPRAPESAASSTISAPSVEQSTEFTVPDTEPLAFETLGFHDDLISGIRDRGFAHTTPIRTLWAASTALGQARAPAPPARASWPN